MCFSIQIANNGTSGLVLSGYLHYGEFRGIITTHDDLRHTHGRRQGGQDGALAPLKF